MAIYVDTSALGKRYLRERGSAEFETFLEGNRHELVISPLGHAELESTLDRLRRTGIIDARVVGLVRASFAADLSAAVWSMKAFEPASIPRAVALMRELPATLVTLDALHLASAIEFGCEALATADRQPIRAALAAGLAVHSFVI